ncbi:MAG: HlyD family efflux transporter periplasmic adaptor subunit [Candidatus Sungbacteria bacterium]|nr:HlyD family efflux transporter periplasmic adaptor subunit [Candidatus Sungbacteria bacterium]
MIRMITKFFSRHVFLAGFIALIIVGGSYGIYRTYAGEGEESRYILAEVVRGTIISSVSGSGQVSATSQVDVKAKASGDVVYVGVQAGQWVEEGKLLVELDARDAQKSVRDAQINLESAKINLEKTKGRQSGEYVLRSSKEKAEDDLKKAYDDGFNTVANAFLDLPGIISGLKNLLLGEDFGGSQWNMDYYSNAAKEYDPKVVSFKTSAYSAYQDARQKYDDTFAEYKATSRFSPPEDLEALINGSYETTKSMAEAVKSADNLIQFYKDIFAQKNLKPTALADTHLNSLSGYTDKTNKHLLNLLSAKNTIQTDKEAVAGSDLDLASQELTVKQKENALLDAQERLADYFVRAPFTGTVAKVNVKKGESISGSAIAATIITAKRTAEISLNEVDIAQVKIGQKSTLTFDAVPGLGIAGETAEVDTIGTVSQGVVSYTVKIFFDTQDERVRPGMSVAAAIITDAKPDVLMVPNSAVKQQGENQYVEMPDDSDLNGLQNVRSSFGVTFAKSLRRQMVEVGVSNDEFTEILSGLEEGDIVVSNTIAVQKTAASAQQQNSSFRIPGLPGGGGGGGGFRR